MRAPSRSPLCRATARLLVAALVAALAPLPGEASLLATPLAVSKGPAGNRTQIDEADGTSRIYTYDELYRLTGETVTIGALNQYTKGFVYDDVGNRQSQTTSIGPAGSPGPNLTAGPLAYAYDERDRLTSETLDANPPTSYGWDEDGNLVTKSGEATYAWDRENRLIRVDKADGTVVEHTYDADGARVRTVTTPSGGSPATTNFLVDTSGSLSHVVAETNAAGALQVHYVRGDDLLSLMRPLVAAPASPTDWQTRYYHSDHIGSVRRLTNEAGQITDGYTYSAFGELLAHTGTDPQPYAFTGEPYDPNLGFQYHRARWMDPRVGGFVGVDPWQGVPQDPSTLHRYLYVGGSPVNAVDPSGLTESLPSLTTGSAGRVTVARISLPNLQMVTSILALNYFTILKAVDYTVAGLTILEGTLMFVEGAANALFTNQAPIPTAPAARGNTIEVIAGRNLGHEFPTYDIHMGDEALISVRSNEYGGDLHRLAGIIEQNAFEAGTEEGPLSGFDAAGEPHTISRDEIRRTPKALVQAIPLEPPVKGNFSAFLARVRQASRQYRVVIRVVPVPGFRSSPR